MEFLYFAILLSLLGFWFFKLPGYKKKQKFFQLFKELTQEQRRSAINIADNKGNTAIHHAAAYNATAVLQFLIDEGADLEVKDNNGYTALHYAASNNAKEAAKILLDAAQKTNKDLLNKTINKRATALHIAAAKNANAVLQLLIDKGADLDAADGYGRTAQQPFILFEFSLG